MRELIVAVRTSVKQLTGVPMPSSAHAFDRDEHQPNLPSAHLEDKPVIHLSPERFVMGGYEGLDVSKILRGSKVNSGAALNYLGTKIDLKEAERLLTLGAVHPTINSTFDNPIPKTPQFSQVSGDVLDKVRSARDPKYFYIDNESIPHHPHIGRHVVAVAAVVHTLASMHQLDTTTTAESVELALVHDASKLAEILLQRIQEVGIDPRDLQLSADEPVASLLRQSGIADTDAQKMVAGTQSVAHSSIIRFLEILPDGSVGLRHGMIEQKLLHLADDMISETEVLDPVARMVCSNFRDKYGYLWTTGLGIIEVGGIKQLIETEIPSKPGIQLFWSFADLQPLLSIAICASILGDSCPPGVAPEAEMRRRIVDELHGLDVLERR